MKALGKAANFGMAGVLEDWEWDVLEPRLDGLQNAFDDGTRMHLMKRIVPLIDRPNAADDRPHIQRSTAKQRQHTFPNRPVVTEAALQRHVLLHQRVQVEPERLGTPADFADPASGADQVDRDFQGRARAGGINHAIAAQPVTLSGPFRRVTDDGFASIRVTCDLQAMRVLFQTDQRDFGTTQSRHRGTKNPDGSWSQNDDPVTGFDASVLDHGVVCHAARLGQAGLFEGNLIGDMMQDPRGNANETCHRPVDAISETFACGVQVVQPTPRHRVVFGDDGGCFGNDAIAFCPARDVLSQGRDVPTELVSQNDGIVNGPRMVGRPLVQVASADATLATSNKTSSGPISGFSTSRISTEPFSGEKLTTAGDFIGAEERGRGGRGMRDVFRFISRRSSSRCGFDVLCMNGVTDHAQAGFEISVGGFKGVGVDRQWCS